MRLAEILEQYEALARRTERGREEALREAEELLEAFCGSEDMPEKIRRGPMKRLQEKTSERVIRKINGGTQPKKAAAELIAKSDTYAKRYPEALAEDPGYCLLQQAMETPKLLLTEEGRPYLLQCLKGPERKQYNWILSQAESDSYEDLVREYLSVIDLPQCFDEITEDAGDTVAAVLKSGYITALKFSRRGNASIERVMPHEIHEYLEQHFDLGTLVRFSLDPYNGVAASYLFNHAALCLPEYNTVTDLMLRLGDKSLACFNERLFAALVEDDVEQRFVTLVERKFNKRAILTILRRNPVYADALKAKEREDKAALELRKNIVTAMPETYQDLYPAARRMKRHFVIHSGPTNSGKTWAGMEALKQAENGVYLAPLRMLALEKYDELNAAGYPCDLLTGEEEKRVEGARFIASTVEMANPEAKYACAVIDECQMITDKFRGGGWTAAILGLQAEEIHLCLSPWAVPIVSKMIDACGDTRELVEHQRSIPLDVEKKPIKFPQEIRDHDAVIVFSRNNVHAAAAELERCGIPCSIIYGNLPYDVRQNEAERFRTGRSKVVVSTDAIGMGMNLPIQRVVFLELEKFDGEKKRELSPEEIRQIAGRAGRRGIFEQGWVTATTANENLLLENAVNVIQSPACNPMIGFPETLLGIERPVSELMKEWQKIPPLEGFLKADLSEDILLAERAERLTGEREIVYRLATISVDTKNALLLETWEQLAARLVSGRLGTARLPRLKQEQELHELELLFKTCDVYFQFGRVFRYDDLKEAAMEAKEQVSRRIIQELKRRGKEAKKCKWCGRPLRWDSPYSVCDRCYTSGRRGPGRR